MLINIRLHNFLKSCPEPTIYQIRLWNKIRLGLLALAVLGEFLIWFVIYKVNINYPPFWLEAPSDWLLKHVPAAQGHSNASYNFREKMPYIFFISVLFVLILTALFTFFNRNNIIINGILNLYKNEKSKIFFVIVFYIGWWVIVYFYMYGLWVAPDQDPTDDIRFGGRTESAFGLLLWFPTFVIVCGPFLGAHGSFAYDLVRCFLFSGKSRRS